MGNEEALESAANQINGVDVFSDYYITESLNSDETFKEEEEEEPSFALDENGFPSNKEEEEEEQEQNLPNNGGNASGSSSENGSFAADFYKSGSDWSILRFNSSSPNSKKLKQKDLFQIWGLKRHKVEEEDENEMMMMMKKKKTTSITTTTPSEIRPKSKSGEVSMCAALSLSVKTGRETVSKLVNERPFASPFRARNQSLNLKETQKRKPVATQARACPFYKKIPGTPFTVDAFRYGAINGCSSYFLSHFHADHYGGLSKAWSHGPIYCTPITARLVKMCLYVNPAFICPLELDVEHVIDGIKVTLLEANHCPGAALIHFHLPDGQCYLHTGDFRACKSMQTYPLLVNKRVNVLYLDTTYCNPKYRFPSKEQVIDFVVRTTKTCLKKQPRTLVIVGAYSIGKECVYIDISEALKVKIHANASRRRILQAFEWPQLSGKLCSNGKETPLHVLPISSLRHETLKSYLKTYQDQFAAVLAFRPTGWTFSESIGDQLDLIKPNSRGNIQIYGVPYSEHSSFTELQEFVQFLKPNKIIPTVNISNAANREKMQSYFRQWLNRG